MCYNQNKFLKDYGKRLVFASDEFYIMSGTPLPSDEEYEEYLQIENGVGLVRVLDNEFKEALNSTSVPDNIAKKTLVTGVLISDYLKELCSAVTDKATVAPIINDFFGHDITVAGLVTGTDIIQQLKDKDLGKYLIIPDVMLRDGFFLDDVSVGDIEKELNIKVITTDGTGKDLLDKLIL